MLLLYPKYELCADWFSELCHAAFLLRLLLVFAHAVLLCIDFVCSSELAALFNVKAGSDMNVFNGVACRPWIGYFRFLPCWEQLGEKYSTTSEGRKNKMHLQLSGSCQKWYNHICLELSNQVLLVSRCVRFEFHFCVSYKSQMCLAA